jgi:hypothetical protein
LDQSTADSITNIERQIGDLTDAVGALSANIDALAAKANHPLTDELMVYVSSAKANIWAAMSSLRARLAGIKAAL